jgi:hypothetical protein
MRVYMHVGCINYKYLYDEEFSDDTVDGVCEMIVFDRFLARHTRKYYMRDEGEPDFAWSS